MASRDKAKEKIEERTYVGSSSSSFHFRGKHFFHQQRTAASAGRIELAATIGPDWIRDASKRNQTLVVTLLVSIVDPLAGKDAIAVVFIGADRRNPSVRRTP